MSSFVARGLVSSCIQHMFMQQDQNDAYHDSLQTEFARFKLWNHGFDGPWNDSLGASSNQLDDVLTYSIHLRESTISILATVVGCLQMKEFGHVGNEQTRIAMQSALDDAIGIYPHIDNTGWETDSDDTPESATEQLRDIINSLFQLAPSLHDQLKKFECATPAMDDITRSHTGLVAASFMNTTADNSNSGMPTIELPTIDDQTHSGSSKVTAREPSQRVATVLAGPANRLPRAGLDLTNLRPCMNNDVIEAPPFLHITSYVRLATVSLIENRRLLGGQVSMDLENMVVESICRESENSRMWANMQLIRICKLDTESKIRAQLQRSVLLNSLDDTYRQLWYATLDNEWTGWIHDMLAWILVGLTPFSARTIFDITEIHQREMTSKANLLPPDTAVLDRLCYGFVRLDWDSGTPLVFHHTASGFLKQQPELATANNMIANTCLAVLSSGNGYQFRTRDIYRYANLHWQEHVRAWNFIDASRSAVLDRFLSDKAAYKRQLACFHQKLDRRTLHKLFSANLLVHTISKSTSSVTLQEQVICAICFSLPVVLRYFLQQMPTVRSPGWLALAVCLGDLSICRVLVQAGVDVNAIAPEQRAARCGGALHIAAAAGPQYIVELLLKYDAKVDRVESNGYTAVQVANNAGQMDAVDLLQRCRHEAMNHRNPAVASGSGPSQLSKPVEREHSTTLPTIPKLHHCPMPDCSTAKGFMMRSDLRRHLRLVHSNRSERHGNRSQGSQ